MKKHVLLIDEDKSELNHFMSAIGNIKGNIKCTYASSSEQALEMLKFIEPHFIFIDYNMPKVNGLQLLSVIKGEPKLKGVKVFIYSENISDEIHKMARILGAAGCIEKHGTISWLTHQFTAIFAGDLMPSYALLKSN
jgi:CheY-like chemotaxis protein